MASREIYTADCETDPFKRDRVPKPFIWGAYNGDEFEYFETVQEFVDFFKNRRVIVYAHNGGKFDWHFLLNHIDEFEPIMVIGGRLAKFKIGECEFRDSYNILPLPLAAYKKDEFDYTKLEANVRKKHWPEIMQYLENDCVFLYEIVSRFISDYGMNLTLAGAAMKFWHNMGIAEPQKSTREFYESLSPYYYGGRVECFETGLINEKFNVIDINSAYPNAMMDFHPYGTEYLHTNKLPDNDRDIAKCFIKLDAMSLGAFPIRTKEGLRFPNDVHVREFTITGHEFLAARDTNCLHKYKIKEVFVFLDQVTFKEYVLHFYAQKEEAKRNGDKAGEINAKLMLNTLYGKYAANPEKYEEYIMMNSAFIEASEIDGYSFCNDFGKNALLSKPLEENKQRYFNIAVAASITGSVRAYLWRHIKMCGGVMYCDTDSIAARDISKVKLDPYKLGEWDLEAKCMSGGIAGKKLYAFKTEKGKYKTASKGVRLSAAEILKVAGGEKVIYMPEAPTFSLKRGITFGSREIVKTI